MGIIIKRAGKKVVALLLGQVPWSLDDDTMDPATLLGLDDARLR